MPETILPDPQLVRSPFLTRFTQLRSLTRMQGEECMFYCKRVGAFSRDYEVYRDEACEEEKWMVIDTEGSIFDDNAYITVRARALRAAPLRLTLLAAAAGRELRAARGREDRRRRDPVLRQAGQAVVR